MKVIDSTAPKPEPGPLVGGVIVTHGHLGSVGAAGSRQADVDTALGNERDAVEPVVGAEIDD